MMIWSCRRNIVLLCAFFVAQASSVEFWIRLLDVITTAAGSEWNRLSSFFYCAGIVGRSTIRKNLKSMDLFFSRDRTQSPRWSICTRHGMKILGCIWQVVRTPGERVRGALKLFPSSCQGKIRSSDKSCRAHEKRQYYFVLFLFVTGLPNRMEWKPTAETNSRDFDY
jgi:hypothetical protein